jgi:acyl-coenzyme A synthetase/AMP-(fatty) acid ligase
MCPQVTGASPTALPPGPGLPRWVQTAGFIFQPARFIEWARRRYGDVVTFRSLFDPCFVMVFDPELTKQVFRGEWVVTGDLVRRDADGYFSYVGRGDDAIKVKGKWLVPAEVEGVLGEHPEVTSAVVVGAPDASGLLKPAAFVTVTAPRDGLEEELQRWVIERLDAYKHPRVIEIVEELPRTHLGKVNRTVMKDRARERLAAGSPAVPEEGS